MDAHEGDDLPKTFSLRVESVDAPRRQESGRDWVAFSARTLEGPADVPLRVARSVAPADTPALLALLQAPEARVMVTGRLVVNIDGEIAVYLDASAISAIGVLDPEERAAEKQARRDADAERLASGTVTPQQLAAENSFFGGLDLPSFRIAAIGRTPIEDLR